MTYVAVWSLTFSSLGSFSLSGIKQPTRTGALPMIANNAAMTALITKSTVLRAVRLLHRCIALHTDRGQVLCASD